MAVFHILLKFQQPFLLPIFFYSPILLPGSPRLPSLLLLPSFLLLESWGFSPSCSFCVWIHISLCLALFSTQNSFLLLFFLVLLAQELWMGWIWGVLGMELRVSCTLSTSCTTKPHFQPQWDGFESTHKSPQKADTWTSLKCSIHC